MAAFFALLPTLLQLLPSIIAFIEQLYGPGNGAQKLASAVDLATKLVPEVAPHLTDDPKKLSLVQDVIGFAVKVMNATGTMPVSAPLNPPATD